MKPIPAPHGSKAAKPGEAFASPAPGAYTSANRRSSIATIQRAYPWLLLLSTAVAAAFFAMYITKPVIIEGQASRAEISSNPSPSEIHNEHAATQNSELLPNLDTLPGENTDNTANRIQTNGNNITQPAAKSAAIAPLRSVYEETNLRVQHILTAEAPGGHVNRIDIDVPVLYQSRNLGWSETEVANARELMLRLMDYQDKTRQLKEEGQNLLVAWNQLVGKSIPADLLRADSPSLPENQEDATKTMRPVDKTTQESIQIESNP